MYYPYFYFWDPTYILVIIGAIICLIASGLVRATYAKYSKVRSTTGLTGAQVAERILASQGITGVQVRPTSGNLTDNYDSRSKTVNLSQGVYNSTSVAAIGIAAHECGHAIQDYKEYAPLNIRTALVPAANLGSTLAWPLIIIGLFFNSNLSTYLIQAGIIFFSLAVLFQLVTLPVEFNASRRAVNILGNSILGQDELNITKKVLTAAALTYVASAAASILSLLRIILLSNRRD